MTFDEQGVLGRFHRALVREIRTKNPELIHAPFTVAEIYQDLVPYRTHRDEIGVEMNADYEHALLRLLSGEGDYLSIESTTARQELRDELASPTPNTGLYRDFAAADVHLNPEKLDMDVLEEAEEADREVLPDDPAMEVVAMEDDVYEVEFSEEEGQEGNYEPLEIEPVGANLEPPEEGGASGELASREVGAELSDEMEGPVIQDKGGEGGGEAEEEDLPPFENCPWCREKLPQQARVRFCPFCGSNVQLVPCPACGEELRLNWRFCIACGTEVES